jgi:hypothetical protein
MSITKQEAQKHLRSLSTNWYAEELEHYEEMYEVQDAETVPTEDLEPHNYKDLRVLQDYLNQKESHGSDEEKIFKEIRSFLDEEFFDWLDMSDCKELCHGYIVKALYHYDLDEDAMLRLESRLIDYSISMGVN